MAESETSVWTVKRGDQLRIESPGIGEATVLVSEPRERTTLSDGRSHAVFVRADGRMVGVNFPPETEVERAILVEDEDRFQHVLVQATTGEEVLMTRRQPGQPDDWEQRDGFEVVVSKELQEQ